jgi:hypothetical protein
MGLKVSHYPNYKIVDTGVFPTIHGNAFFSEGKQWAGK